MKPNLFLIGAMKSGTTSLHAVLNSHPQIFMSEPKEPMFFSRHENWRASLKEYLLLFHGSKDEIYQGESSTEYTKRPEYEGVAERIYEFNPDAKLIYIMRDPFERCLSQYWYQVANGHEDRSIREALTICSNYVQTSNYSYQLRPYYELFPHEHIFLCSFEEFRDAPEDFVKRLFIWLGVECDTELCDLKKRHNPSPMKMQKFSQQSVLKRLHSMAREVRVLQNVTPSFARRWLRYAIPKTGEIDRKSASFRQEVDDVRGVLVPMLQEYMFELEKMANWKYGGWLKNK